MTLFNPAGKPIRSFGAFGLRRKIHLSALQAGMMTCDPIIGKRGNVLVCEGETLTQRHIDQLKSFCERTGDGCLLLYTKEIWVKTATGSVDLVPRCEEDVEQAFSLQKLYKRGNKVTHGRPKAAARKTYKMIKGTLTEIPS